MADSAVLREKPVISPGNVPASKWTLPRIYKIKNSHDTKPCFGGLSLRSANILYLCARSSLISQVRLKPSLL